MELKQYIAEAFSKEYGYRVKLAQDCGNELMDILEKCPPHNFVSATPLKELHQENPRMEFSPLKAYNLSCEVCSSRCYFKISRTKEFLKFG